MVEYKINLDDIEARRDGAALLSKNTACQLVVMYREDVAILINHIRELEGHLRAARESTDRMLVKTKSSK